MKATGDTSEATLRETRDESGIEKGSEGKTKTLAAGAEVKFAGEAIKEKSKYKNEEEMSRESMAIIKAKTMYEMVQQLANPSGAGERRLLFLTNPQADLIATTEGGIENMLNALEVQPHKLVINFLASAGFEDYCGLMGEGGFDTFRSGGQAGLISNR
mgnify:CR=1 FL=1